MFTTIAFSELLATDATIAELAGVPDQTHRVHDDDIYIGKLNKVVGEAAMGAQLGDAYLISPSLRRVARKYIAPLVVLPSTYNFGYLWNWHGESPLGLDTNEALNAFAEESVVSAVDNPTIGVWLADGVITPIHGEIWTVKASATFTVAQKAWTNSELTWTPDLPVGKYQIVGARGYMVYPGLFRFNFVGQAHRPGGVVVNENFLTTLPAQRNGGMGVWGEFEQVLPPSIDCLTAHVAGDTGIYLRIDLIKIA